MKRTSSITIIFVSLFAVVSAAAVFYYFQDGSLSRVRQPEGTLRIGYAIEAPYAFLKPGGEITGESPEVAKRIVQMLRLERIEWRQAEFGSLIAGLDAGRFDVIAAGMFITPERAERIAFSEPTFHVQQGLLVAKGNPLRIDSYQRLLALSDARVAVISGAVEETLLRRMGLAERQLVFVPDALAGRVAVESGMADGLALSSPTIRWMGLRDQLGKTQIAHPFDQPEPALKEKLGFGAFAFRPKDRQLLAAWNAQLKRFIGTQEHKALIFQFGFSAEELPGGVSTREVLGKP